MICPILTVDVNRCNEYYGSSHMISAEIQRLLDTTIINANAIFNGINRDYGLKTPRYDRGLFHYQCRNGSWKTYLERLDITGLGPGDRLSTQVADKIAQTMSDNFHI